MANLTSRQERDLLVAQALRYLDDAIEGADADEGYLLANDPDNVWCRVFSARSNLRAAIRGPEVERG